MGCAQGRPWLALLAAACLSSCSGIAAAVDLQITGFGTAGYARTFEHDLTYLRYIDHDGTFKADSLVGVQAEVQINPQFGATVQAVASAPRTRDDGYEAKVRWAFVSLRPENDWLLRLGRVRPPVFINTQNAEVGVTYDTARLPAEVYTLSPVYDVDGAAITKTWHPESAEISLDGYWGKADVKYRAHYQSDPPARYFPERITATGLVLSYASGPVLLRGGFHHAELKATGSERFPEEFSPMTIPGAPPIGGTLYVPSGTMSETPVQLFTLGADWRGEQWRITAEYGKRRALDSDLLVNDQSGYVTVARRLAAWTPYVTYARMLSRAATRNAYRSVYDAPVPLAVQVAPPFLPSSYHRMLGDGVSVFDQHSTMLGASYAFSPTSKLKMEWMRTTIGITSMLVDGEAQNRSFNVLTLSYSVAF